MITSVRCHDDKADQITACGPARLSQSASSRRRLLRLKIESGVQANDAQNSPTVDLSRNGRSARRRPTAK